MSSEAARKAWVTRKANAGGKRAAPVQNWNTRRPKHTVTRVHGQRISTFVVRIPKKKAHR